MSAPGSRNVITADDIDTAQAVIDAWAEATPYVAQGEPGLGLPMLRGLITQVLADKRGEGHSDGYALGLLTGRREIAHLVRDALAGEGL